MYSWNWRNDSKDIEYNEDNSYLFDKAGACILAADRKNEDNDPDFYEHCMEAMDCETLEKIELDSFLYHVLLLWYGNEKIMLKHVNGFLVNDGGDDDGLYWYHGGGYDIWSQDLLGGSADGEASRMFDTFVTSFVPKRGIPKYRGYRKLRKEH